MMSIIKGLIFVIVYFSSLSVIYSTEYNTPALLCIVSMSVFFMMYVFNIKKELKLKIQTNRKLYEKLVSQRNYFTEVLVHDLKVPTIAQLRGLEILKNETIGSLAASQKDMISQIEQSCKYILEMISMIIATYKLELDEYDLYYERINLPELLLEGVKDVSPLLQEKDVSFSYMATQADAFAEADRAEMKKVITALLSTAIMYSKSGEKILVNITTKNNNLKFSVITRGKALTEEECASMFSYCANNPKYGAVGHDIGLYLSKKIIDAHRGRIYASSDGIATNTFTFIIPQNLQEAVLENVYPVLV